MLKTAWKVLRDVAVPGTKRNWWVGELLPNPRVFWGTSRFCLRQTMFTVRGNVWTTSQHRPISGCKSWHDRGFQVVAGGFEQLVPAIRSDYSGSSKWSFRGSLVILNQGGRCGLRTCFETSQVANVSPAKNCINSRTQNIPERYNKQYIYIYIYMIWYDMLWYDMIWYNII